MLSVNEAVNCCRKIDQSYRVEQDGDSDAEGDQKWVWVSRLTDHCSLFGYNCGQVAGNFVQFVYACFDFAYLNLPLLYQCLLICKLMR